VDCHRSAPTILTSLALHFLDPDSPMMVDSGGFLDSSGAPDGVPCSTIVHSDAHASRIGEMRAAWRQLTDSTGRTYAVRPYTGTDREALQAMYEAFEPKRVAQGLPPAEPAGIRHWLDRVLARGEHVVVEEDGRIVGHAMLIPMEDGGAELANFLHQSIRGRGLGTALNRVMVELAGEVGYRRVWLCVEPWNRAAVRSYLKAGFRILPGTLTASEVEMEAIPRSPARE